MWPFGIAAASAVPQYFALCQLFSSYRINLAKHDPIGVGDHVAFSVLKKEGWIYSTLLQIDRL